MVAVLLAIASRERNVVMVDEVENGIYFKHHLPFWRALLNARSQMDGQLFLTTHSDEWLKAMVAGSNGAMKDVAVWRMRRGREGEPELDRMSLANLKDGIELGVELR
jgi:predicted ATPase